MNVVDVSVKAGDGPVSVRVEDADHPQAVAGVVWRFKDENTRESPPAGTFGEGTSDVPLGDTDEAGGKIFFVDGRVLPFMDAPAGAYQVTVSVLQDGDSVHDAVPPDGGTGTVGSTACPFRYSFRVVVQ